MKRTALILAAAGLLFQPGSALADVKLAYIDSEVLKEQLPELKTVRRKLEQLEQEFRREASDQESKLLQMREDFRKQELLMSEQRKAEMEQLFQQKMDQLQQFQNEKFGPEGELLKKNIELSTPIFDKINEALRAISEEEGYDFVFDSGAGIIVYADEKHDLTEKLLERLEEEREEEEKQGP